MTLSIVRPAPLVSVGKRLTTTAATAVYTAQVVNRSAPTLTAIRLTPVLGNAVTASIVWFDASASASFALLVGRSIPADQPYVDNFELQMREGDEIRVTAGTANALDVVVTVLEPTGPNQ